VRARSFARPLPLALVLLMACGRRATHDDCQLLVDRSVELQMRGASENDVQAIARREAEVRAELDDEINRCEKERRVTDKMMSCVRSAASAAQLDACLR
jgi:uncharacterized membrane protein